jgi:hypothetical protein
MLLILLFIVSIIAVSVAYDNGLASTPPMYVNLLFFLTSSFYYFYDNEGDGPLGAPTMLVDSAINAQSGK